MDDNQILNLLQIVLVVMVAIAGILLITYIILKMKINKKEKSNESIEEKLPQRKDEKEEEATKKAAPTYTKASVMDFMEFDTVEDNMIVQKKGKRYLMVIECQGVNYDLMSQMEKVAVEEGFQQFLNTLRYPIQIYIQTRTVNLESSLGTYKDSVKKIESKYNQMNFQYNTMKESGEYTNQQLDEYFYELTKQKNLYEYGKDIIYNTEKMSQNKNILNKKYYVIIPYYSEESTENYSVEEIRGMAFSELYTKAQAIIRALSTSSVSGKILNSEELVELLYVAYNRDESDIFGLERALRAGYDELYSTAPDVLNKKIRALDNKIQEEAIDLANSAINKAKNKKQEMIEQREKDMNDLIDQMAATLIEENKSYIGEDIAEEALKELDKKIKEGEDKNEKAKKTGRSRK